MDSLTPEDIQAVLQFLDRAEIKGHQERDAMNVIVHKLVTLRNQLSQEDSPPVE